MNENDPRYGNIFIDPGLDPAKARVMRFRAEAMVRVKERLEETGWTQTEAARRLGVTQQRISRLVSGRIEDFSLDMLLILSIRAGLHPELWLS
jgi:predicted XRE-type DNA-binding protein